MSKHTINTIEQQLAEIDPIVIGQKQYLHLYARPDLKGSFWFLMVRNVFLPYSFDRELERPKTRNDVEYIMKHVSYVLGCQSHFIPQFSTDYQERKPFLRCQEQEELSHPITLGIAQNNLGFNVLIRNTNYHLSYTLGITRKTSREAENDLRSLKNFYEKPHMPLPLPCKRAAVTNLHCSLN
jgi:hypothetical protein